MAQSVSDIKTRYPVPLYNFRVTVGSDIVSFTEISGIQVEYEYVTYRHGLSFLEGEEIQSFTRTKFFSMTCKRGTVPGADPTFLFDWLEKRDLRSITIDLCDESGAATMFWKIKQAVPTSLKAPSFSAQTNEVSIDSLELQAKGVSFGKY